MLGNNNNKQSNIQQSLSYGDIEMAKLAANSMLFMQHQQQQQHQFIDNCTLNDDNNESDYDFNTHQQQQQQQFNSNGNDDNQSTSSSSISFIDSSSNGLQTTSSNDSLQSNKHKFQQQQQQQYHQSRPNSPLCNQQQQQQSYDDYLQNTNTQFMSNQEISQAMAKLQQLLLQEHQNNKTNYDGNLMNNSQSINGMTKCEYDPFNDYMSIDKLSNQCGDSLNFLNATNKQDKAQVAAPPPGLDSLLNNCNLNHNNSNSNFKFNSPLFNQQQSRFTSNKIFSPNTSMPTPNLNSYSSRIKLQSTPANTNDFSLMNNQLNQSSSIEFNDFSSMPSYEDTFANDDVFSSPLQQQQQQPHLSQTHQHQQQQQQQQQSNSLSETSLLLAQLLQLNENNNSSNKNAINNQQQLIQEALNKQKLQQYLNSLSNQQNKQSQAQQQALQNKSRLQSLTSSKQQTQQQQQQQPTNSQILHANSSVFQSNLNGNSQANLLPLLPPNSYLNTHTSSNANRFSLSSNSSLINCLTPTTLGGSSSISHAGSGLLSANGKPLRSERLPQHVIDDLVRQAKMRRRNGGKKEVCVFCRNNGEKELIYTSHTLKDTQQRVICPILKLYQCPICHATDEQAHTIKYCPYAASNINDASLLSTANNTQQQSSFFKLSCQNGTQNKFQNLFFGASSGLTSPPMSPPLLSNQQQSLSQLFALSSSPTSTSTSAQLQSLAMSFFNRPQQQQQQVSSAVLGTRQQQSTCLSK